MKENILVHFISHKYLIYTFIFQALYLKNTFDSVYTVFLLITSSAAIYEYFIPAIMRTRRELKFCTDRKKETFNEYSFVA